MISKIIPESHDEELDSSNKCDQRFSLDQYATQIDKSFQ